MMMMMPNSGTGIRTTVGHKPPLTVRSHPSYILLQFITMYVERGLYKKRNSENLFKMSIKYYPSVGVTSNLDKHSFMNNVR